MSPIDFRGCTISGATPRALDAFERGLGTFLSWRAGTAAHVAQALDDSPGFVMAHVLDAYAQISGRDPARVRAARPTLDRASALPANARERLHLAAIGAVLDDDYDRARGVLGTLLRDHPRDVLALQVAHSFDYLGGDLARLGDRVARVLPHWSAETSGYSSVLAMHAFGFEERGDYDGATRFAERALALQPLNARAHHVLAHVFEMTRRPDEGVRWLVRHAPQWSVGTVVATHGWWHMALFELQRGDILQALALYDHRVRAGRSAEVSDLIDAAALLWRIELAGAEIGGRWRELAAAWAPHVDDGFCTFNDVHAMMAFVGANDWALAGRLTRELESRGLRPTRHGETTRRIGLKACQALVAFGRRNYTRAIGLLASLRRHAHRIGGSHAQRSILRLTLRQAIARLVNGNRASASAIRPEAA